MNLDTNDWKDANGPKNSQDAFEKKVSKDFKHNSYISLQHDGNKKDPTSAMHNIIKS
jgi:hypothetical protein